MALKDFSILGQRAFDTRMSTEGDKFQPREPGLFTTLGRALTGLGQGLQGKVVEFEDIGAANVEAERKFNESRQSSGINPIALQIIASQNPELAGQLLSQSVSIGGAPQQGVQIPPDQAIAAQNQQAQVQPNIVKASGGFLELTPQAAGAAEGLKAGTKEKKEAEIKAQESAKDIANLAKSFQLSQAELISTLGPEVDDATLGGFGLRLIGKAMEVGDLLPETSAFRDQIQATATPLAKSAGEDRLTNEDIKRFTALLGDTLSGPSEENVNKFADLLERFANKGADLATIRQTFATSGGSLKAVISRLDTKESLVQKAGETIDKSKGIQTIGGYKVEILD